MPLAGVGGTGLFSRSHKYSLGADLRDGARRVLKRVVRADARRDKVPVLPELREELEELKERRLHPVDEDLRAWDLAMTSAYQA